MGHLVIDANTIFWRSLANLSTIHLAQVVLVVIDYISIGDGIKFHLA